MTKLETLKQELRALIKFQAHSSMIEAKAIECAACALRDEIDRSVIENFRPVISLVEDHIDIVRVAGSTPAPGTKIMGL